MKGWFSGWLLWAVLVAATAACAQSKAYSGRPYGGHNVHLSPSGQSLFISPGCQPFRADPVEPYPVARGSFRPTAASPPFKTPFR